jgi:lantibiotic modifying enzyme
MLWNPEMHAPLTDERWEEGRVRRRIDAIIADADAAYSPDEFWPADEWDAWRCPLPLINLYVGAAGVIWALDALRRRGYETRLDLAAAAERLVERWRIRPDFVRSKQFELPTPRESAFLTGGSGVVFVTWRLAPSDELADDLHARVLANKENEAVEVMWGSPGTMLAARTMHESTGDERWADAWRECADELIARRDADGLWPTKLYGNEYRGLTPPHGVVGNVGALLDGGALLAEKTRELLIRDTNDVLARTAVVEDGLANWSHPAGQELDSSKGHARVQWCAGAPGILISASSYLDEELLLAGAELIWRAGPLGMEKGAGICHGTAGNGYAFLKVFERTGDERWLERARRFAVHALEQVEQRGQGRYSLFTGDIGAALFAADCIDARAQYPIMDVR